MPELSRLEIEDVVCRSNCHLITLRYIEDGDCGVLLKEPIRLCSSKFSEVCHVEELSATRMDLQQFVDCTSNCANGLFSKIA